VIDDLDGFMLIAGERRLRAAKMAGLKKIKAVVATIDKKRYREFALIENIQREDLSPLELAHSYKELIEDYGITHEELAKIVKKSRAHITNTLRLLGLGDYAKEALMDGRISAGHAKVLVGLDEDEQRVMVDSIVGQRLSVRDVEKMAKRGAKRVAKEGPDLRPAVDLLAELGFRAKRSGSRLVVEFTNGNEVERFVTILKKFGDL